MNNANITKKILTIVFKEQNSQIINEIIKGTSMKFLGYEYSDLYIFTTKKFISKLIFANLSLIKETINSNLNKNLKNIYLNNKKINFNLSSLNEKKNIEIIDLDKVNLNKINEISNENKIYSNIFFYDLSIFNKKKVILSFYNKYLNKEYKYEIKTSILTSEIYLLRKKFLERKIKSILEMQYYPNNNDTKEIIKVLKINS